MQLHTLSHVSAVGLARGARGKKVTDLQTYLAALGYLDQRAIATPGTFDKTTSNALKLFQRFYKLPQSGKIDRATSKRMRAPRRCGVPDIIRRGGPAILRNPWPKNDLRYYFYNIDTSPDIDTREKAAEAAQRGFDLWNPYTPIRWSHTTENTEANPADLVISWGGVGCGGAACTDWPDPNMSISQAGMRFWSRPTWKVSNVPDYDYDFVAFCGHEVGHALGVYFVIGGKIYSHSDDEDALMYPEIPANRRRLNATDIEGARRRYQS